MYRSRILVVAVVAVLVVAFALAVDAVRRPAAAAEAQVVTLDGHDHGRTFDGVGGVSAGGSSRLLRDYPEPERSQILDYLFRPGYGASLDLLKVEIGGDVDATEGAEPSHMRTPDSVDCHRGYEWWLMREAKARNPHIRFYGLAWGAPGWFSGGDYWSPDRVTYLLSWLRCAKANGFHVDYLGGGNESGYDRDFYVRLAAALDEHGWSDAKVVASDDHHPPDYWYVAQPMPSDKAFADAVDVLGEHDVCEWRTEQRTCHGDDTALGLGKPLWDSENSTQDYDVGAAPLARAMNRHYIDARITGNLNWALLDAWYDDFPIGGTGLLEAQRPWSGAYEIGPEIWVDAQTTQFTEPGWRYLDGASGYSTHGASYVSLRAPDSGDHTTVVETLDETRPETFRLQVTGGLDAGKPVHVWSTDVATQSTADDFVELGTVRPVNGSVTLGVQPGHVYTVSTTTGQHKGTARSHADPGSRLAVPYREDFEHVRRGGIARYVSDVHGGFAAEPCAGGRQGMCYEQTVPTQPLPWHGVVLPPTTMVGDPRWWGDYEVGADVLLNGADDVELLGRVDSQQHNAAGYHLRLASDGRWTLFSEDLHSTDRTLASGSTAAPGKDTWHQLSLRFRGDGITASLDGTELASVRDDAHTSGQVGVRVGGWTPAQFDDVSVVPTAPWPKLLSHQGMTATATSEHAANDFGHAYPASHAIDDRLWSTWRSEYAPPEPLPQAITLDLGRTRDVAGVTYTPSVAQASGQITRYRVDVSADGHSYATAAEGYWEPTEAVKTASWQHAVRARYVRLVALDVHGCPSSPTVAELNVSTTPLPSLGAGTPPSDPPPDYQNLVPKGEMSATATSQQPGYEAGKAVDGDCTTMWHTSWSPYQPPPQSITLDLGRSYRTTALVYQPRQDGSRNGVVGQYEIAVSSDGATFTKVASGDWPTTDDVKHADWSPAAARYVRLTATGGNGYVSAAELAVAYDTT
ncbi:MAG TPA: discoidin domain-containing protein [Streptosporangiales bacterium]